MVEGGGKEVGEFFFLSLFLGFAGLRVCGFAV